MIKEKVQYLSLICIQYDCIGSNQAFLIEKFLNDKYVATTQKISKKKKKEYGLLNKIAVTEIVEKNANFYYRALNVNKLLPVNR